MRSPNYWFWSPALVLAFLFPQTAFSQSEQLCNLSDSTASLAAGLDDISHLFGSNTTTWPHEFVLSADSTYRAFTKVFRLHLTNHVSGRFSSPEWEDIINSIMSNDTTATGDHIFGRVWDYFLREDIDENGAYAGVRFAIRDSTYTKIHVYLYDTAGLHPKVWTGLTFGSCDYFRLITRFA